LTYKPHPIDTSHVALTPEVLELTERLAEHAHDVWACQRIADGWTHGPKRDDARKEHPCLIPYDQLPDTEKPYDRAAALETLKAIIALGYSIEQPISLPPPRLNRDAT
jgi:ryanodine receptor 2